MDFESLRRRIHGTGLEPLEPFLLDSFLDQIKHGDFRRWRRCLAALPAITADEFRADDSVCVGAATEIDEAVRDKLRSQLQEFIPWRKGPFSVFGIDIDAEWRSDLKWNRLREAISPLAGRTVLDVGCGNGYYGFRMVAEGAELVVGIDQHIPYVAQFWAIKHFVPALPVYALPLSLDSLPHNLESFDSVFSMGVLYHLRSPIDHLLQMKAALKPGGELVLETLYVEGDAGYSLTPDSKYARMSNVWFIPSIATLQQWLKRCGFKEFSVVDKSVTNLKEQRQTDWMPFDSLAESLDPNDRSKTIEDLPAPQRVVIVATRD